LPTQSAYRSQTQDLFQALTSPLPLIPNATIDGYVNRARMQVASEGECVRTQAVLSILSGIRLYGFGALSVSPAADIAAIISVRSGFINGAGGPLEFRPYEWLSAYCLWSTAVGRPVSMAQQGQGQFGTLVFCPTPNAAYSAVFDTVGIPIPLVDDTTPDVIPYPWSDAVPFYAAWLCMMNAQRQADADSFFGRYEQIMMRLARMGATPSELPDNVPMDRGLRQQGG
jgi:hypothetical protein